MTNTEDDEPLAPPAELQAAATSDLRATKILCANCGAELFGPHCYSCGQPVKGMVRQLSSIVADMADTVLNIDSRIFRTLWPLLVKPGFLTNEYLAGRRVRYVTPFRLYFFLSVIAFLVMQIGLDATLDLSKGPININDDSSISSAQTAEQVQAQRDAALAGLEQAKSAATNSARALRGIQKAQDKIHAEADKRLEYFKEVDAAKAEGKPPPPDPQTLKHDEDFNFEIAGTKWDPKTSPIAIGWLPGFVNARLNVLAMHMVDNLPRIKKNPKPLLLGAFSTLPQVLFVVMPLFALLLKIFYIFKRRLYMEHVMVALHSHSFIFLSLLLITLAGLASSAVSTSAPWLSALLGWVIFALGWWLPIYLLIMQKRVYRQGWFMTVIKYLTIGLCYTILVSFGIVAALIISLATT
ncbi:MAG TPA: DUF3667 domain-containing protein [Rudaea sp.]